MSQQDRFERILASLHETVLDDGRWPATSALIDEACGAKGNFLVTGDGAVRDDIDIFFARFCFRGQRAEDLERLYFRSYHAVDERMPRLRQLPDSQLVHVSSLFTDKEKQTSLVYNEALPLAHTRDSLNVRLDEPDGSRIVWVIADPIDAAGWSSERVETIECLLPHLRQFVRVRQALVDARALGASLAALLENTRCGVIQLDRRARIVAANHRARAFLRKGDGLLDEQGVLRAASRRDDVDLQGLLTGALPPFGGQGESGSITVARPVAALRLAVHVSPVGEGRTDFGAVRAAALVLVVDPLHRVRIDPDMVEAALGLTPAESRVAVLLAQGRTVHEIAVEKACNENTVRWHLKQINIKLHLSRQMELVQLVRSLADFPEGRR